MHKIALIVRALQSTYKTLRNFSCLQTGLEWLPKTFVNACPQRGWRLRRNPTCHKKKNQYFNILTVILLIQTSQRATRKVSHSIFCYFKLTTCKIKLYTCIFGYFCLYFPSIFHKLASLSVWAFKRAVICLTRSQLPRLHNLAFLGVIIIEGKDWNEVVKWQ